MKGSNSMSLKTKVGIILISIFILYLAVDFGIQRHIILPSFLSIERDEAIKDSKRSVLAIQREIHHLDSLCHDWSAWDDTYEFVESQSKEYTKANLIISSFIDNKLNLIYIVNKTGKVVWGEIHNLKTEEIISVADFPKNRLPKLHPLISYDKKNKPLSDLTISGVYMSQKGPLLISSRPILNSNNEGPIRGSVIMGRFLDDNIVKTLIGQTQVEFKVFPFKADSLPKGTREILNKLNGKSPYLIEEKGDDQLQIYTIFPDVNNDAAILVATKTPRKIALEGAKTVNYAMYSVIVAGLGLLIIMILLLQFTVLKPITALTNHAMSVEKTSDLSARLSMRRQDEIGILAIAFDNMLEQLERNSAKLEEDIAMRVKIESELRESEKRYRMLFEKAADAIFLIKAEGEELGKIVGANQAAAEMHGYTIDELMNLYIQELDTPDVAKDIPERIQHMWEGKWIKEEITHRKKDGTVFPVEISAGLLELGDQKYILAFDRDISERKLIEKALQESKEKYSTVLEAIPDPIVVYDIEGKVTYFNPAFKHVFGWTMEERLGKKMDLFVPEKAWPETKMMIEKVLAGDTFTNIETSRHNKKGEIIPVSVSGATFKDRDGNSLGSVINLRDISEKKKLEDQLQQAHKMEAMGTLAGGIAHDFNNLLMGIQGRTSLMLMDSDTAPSYFEHLKGIEDYVKNAADLTKQLLGFARGGKYEVKPAELNGLIKKQNQMFGRTRKEINIQEKFERNLWTVEVDRTQVKQVLLNIYVNAWQAMPGGGDLYIQTENTIIDESYSKPYQVEPGRYVKISITDSGVGMDEATKERIFDPFFTTKDMGRGTGLGLASAYGIIKNHNGFVNVYSEKGEGTTFNIYFPASAKEAVKEKKIDEELMRGSETILLVDDEDMIIEVGQGIIENLGYEVLIANSGEAAIEIYKKNSDRIDMVILDMIMPGIGGGETYDKLKEINPDIKALLSSGYSINGQATEIMEQGCNGFIQKPFNIGKLSKKIRGILDKD
jgi:PAS domain S-box-containing protein